MSKTNISGGVTHNLPEDLKEALRLNPEVVSHWEDITPLARNEFICWIEDAKQTKTRRRRIKRTCEDLISGKRRPCCWSGCAHRNNG